MDPPSPDFAVRREVLQSFFTPSIGKSTFYDLVESGKIVKVKGLRGYYRLNESLRRLGLAPVEKLPRGEGMDHALDEVAVAEVALSLAMPGELPLSAELLTHALTAEEILKVARLQRVYADQLREIHTREERLGFAQGVRDAAVMLLKTQRS